MFNVLVSLHIFKQVKPKLIQTKVHDRDTAVHLLNIHDFLLQLLELCLAVFQITFLFRGNKIVVTGRGHYGHLHPCFNTSLQVNVFIKSHIWPEVNQLDNIVLRADSVNTSKALNNAHRVPVDIVVYEIVAVLQVLSLADAVSSYEHLNFFLDVWINHIPLF